MNNLPNLKQAFKFKEHLNKVASSGMIPAIKDFSSLSDWYNLIKTAANDKDVESSFFELAYAKLQDKLFNLLPFLIGFEMIDKEEDGTKILGVFGFKGGNGQIIYVPAFFMNGSVKGVDIMYSKNNEQFYPLNEDFAELLLKNDATGLGEPSKESLKTIRQGLQPTDMRDLVRPPRTGKISYASLMDFVGDGDEMVKAAFVKLFKEEKFMEAVLRFYPLEKVAKTLAMTSVSANDKKHDLGPMVDNPFAHGGLRMHTKPEDVNQYWPQDVVCLRTGDVPPIGTTDEVKQKFANEGYALIDKRADQDKSLFGLVKYEETFTNPTESGFYSYLTQHGKIRYALILTNLLKLNVHFASDEAIVMDLKSGQSYKLPTRDILVRNKYYIKDYNSVYSKMIELAEVEPSFDESYILINERLIATQPFRVRANSKEDGVRKIEIETTGLGQPMGTSSLGTHLTGNFYDKPSKFIAATLIQTKRTTDRVEITNGEIFVPKGFKLLAVSLGHSDSEGKPGSLKALHGSMAEKKIFPMTVRSNGSEYFLTIGQAKKKYPNALEAKIALVMEAGLDEKTAEEIMDKDEVDGTIKIAYTGDYTPQMQDPNPYANQFGQPTYDGRGWMQTIAPDQYYTGDPTQMGLAVTHGPDGDDSGYGAPQPGGVQSGQQGVQKAIGQASQLAQDGQKQIFDTHSIATLAKYVSPSAKIQSYMPDFISCLDKLGRMLFLTHWQIDKFEDLFGRSELPELVELLTDVNSHLGDLIIFLKRKNPEISINMSQDELGV